MNYIRQHPLLTAILINLVLFSIIAVAGFPIFNSGDDVYLLYLLSGGFGQPPTELLHYHYGMHPYMGLLLKNLFAGFPGFNFYAGLLYLFHFVACTVILTQWLKKNAAPISLAVYLLIFSALEVRFLLQPTFTNTALVTAMSGLLLLYNGLRIQQKNSNLLAASCLLFIAALFRLHLLIPAIVLAIPFLAAVTKKQQVKRLFAYAIFLLISITIFSVLQYQYYKQHIPNWQQEEAYRQTVIHHYNIPKKTAEGLPETIQIRADFLDKGILWDKEFLSASEVTATTKAVELSGAWQQADFKERLYWLLIESRLAVLVMLLIFFWKLPSLTRIEKTVVISSALLLLVMCMVLLLFRKIPGYVIIGGALEWIAFTALAGSKPNAVQPVRNWLFPIAWIFLLAWSAVRLYKHSSWNRQQHLKFQCAYKHVASSPDKLFIVTDDQFPMDYFHVWDTPHQYPLPNLLYKDHFLNNTYQHAYKRCGIQHPLQFINNKAIIFTGDLSASVTRYYELKTRKRISFVADAANNCISTGHLYQTGAANQ
jgi:hypothetical protein